MRAPCNRKEEFDDPTCWTLETWDADETRNPPEWGSRCDPRRADCTLHSFSRDSRTKAGVRILALPWPARPVSGGRDAPGDLSKPGRKSVGWRNREYSLLGASRCWSEVPSLRDQLRASRVPDPLVSAVWPV